MRLCRNPGRITFLNWMNCDESHGASDCPGVFYVNYKMNLASLVIDVKISLLSLCSTSTAVESLRCKMNSCIILLMDFMSNWVWYHNLFPWSEGCVVLWCLSIIPLCVQCWTIQESVWIIFCIIYYVCSVLNITEKCQNRVEKNRKWRRIIFVEIT